LRWWCCSQLWQAQDKLVALYACGVMVATITSCLTQEKKRETLAINS
jgi:hypothetical protein